MRTTTVVVLLCNVAAVGCTGEISDTPNAALGGPTGGSAGTTAPRGPVIASPDTGLWRLTRTEYSNTVRDLLGDTSHAGNALNPDVLFNGFDNNAGLLQTAVPTVDKYDAAATDLVDNAFRPNSASRKNLLGTCDPVAKACARTVVSTFARRAWRRPVESDSEEMTSLMASLDVAGAQGDSVEEGVKLALRTALVSPNFLYRVEIDPRGRTGLHPVSPHELATRLSYFVWSSMPDPELSGHADDGSLSQPEVFAAQLTRALADKKADALVENFAVQWLGLRKLDTVSPDPKAFRIQSFDEDLRKAMAAEPQAFFRAFLKGERSMIDMFDADFTFANERLAKHYALPGVTGSQMRQVPVGGNTHRFGLLSQAAFLTATSNPDRTVPVKRGKWVLDRLLCSPPPEPPADVGPLETDPKKVGLGAAATIRDLMAKHIKEPRCASCHAGMDPIGFSLEHYDGIGRWRDAYQSGAIDARGNLPNGPDFDGAVELSRQLKADPRFVSCVAKTVFAYALGRDPAAAGDQAAVEKLTSDFVQRGGRIRDLVALVAASNAFQLRGGQQW